MDLQIPKSEESAEMTEETEGILVRLSYLGQTPERSNLGLR